MSGLLLAAPRDYSRFWGKVERDGDGCWLWTGARQSRGYGNFSLGGTMHLSHRIAYQDVVGPIPEGLSLDHLCRNRGCVNPAHLEPVTHRENVLRGVGPTAENAKMTHCSKGHAFRMLKTGKRAGERYCRECIYERRRVFR